MSDNTVWTMGSYVTAWRTLMRARTPTAKGVLLGRSTLGEELDITAAPIARDLLEREAISLIRVRGEEEPAALGNSRNEEVYYVEGIVYVEVDGMTETDADEARTRALLLLGEVETLVRTNYSMGLNTTTQVIRYSHMFSKDLEQGIADGKRQCLIPFEIKVSTRTEA